MLYFASVRPSGENRTKMKIDTGIFRVFLGAFGFNFYGPERDSCVSKNVGTQVLTICEYHYYCAPERRAHE